MNDRERKLSDYIDSLNNEKKSKEHGSEIETEEVEELFETVRLVRSLKGPSLPEGNYAEKLASNINKEMLKEKNLKKSRKRWFLGIASAAVVALVVTLNIASPFGNSNMVYAMEKAFSGVKAYHGVLEVVETNAAGKSTMQSKAEVWADKKGRYYVKGIEGAQKDLITANDGKKKWQVQPSEKEVDVFAAFPDPYSFTFEIGKEIDTIKNAIKTKIVGDDTVAGRAAVVIEVTPQGGNPYKIWIDKETKMPLQRQSAMENSIQYKVRYDNIDFTDNIPKELLTYSVPKGFKGINTNPEQVVNSLEEALTLFIKGLTNGTVELSSPKEQSLGKPQVKVPVDLKIEEAEQKSVDAGHSPWRLDPAYVAQVFVSLKISPEGIQGDYPIKYEELKVVQNTGKGVIVEVSGDKTPIRRVYLKRLIRQDNTGIWTVVGYDPVKE